MGCRETGGAAAPWESLCDDVKPAILGHLSVPDLARAAVTCREVRDAYSVRLVAERLNLISLIEETYNQALVKAFVGVIRQAMCQSGRQLLDWIDEDRWSAATIDMSGCLRPAAKAPFPHHKSQAALHAPPLDGYPGPFMSLGALVFHEKENGGWESVDFDVIKFCKNDARVGLCVTADRAVASAAVGLLLATCAGFEDMPARVHTPAMVTLVLRHFPLGGRGKKEAECLIAPVRHLAKSVVITEMETEWPWGLEPAHMVPEAGLEYPLGHLRVWILVPYRMTRRGIMDSLRSRRMGDGMRGPDYGWW
jgi:hypothetical protein